MSVNYFNSAIYWKIHTCVAWQLSSSWLLLLSFLTRLFCTQYKKIDVKTVGCKDFPFIDRYASSFHVLAMRSCYSMNNAIPWIIYIKDIAYKKSFSIPIACNSFFLSNWLSFLREKLIEQHMLFKSKYVCKSEKKENSQKSKKNSLKR